MALRPSPGEQFIEERRRAARLMGYVNSRLATLQASREYTEQQEYDETWRAFSDAIDAEELLRLTNEGAAWDEDRAVAEAMLI